MIVFLAIVCGIYALQLLVSLVGLFMNEYHRKKDFLWDIIPILGIIRIIIIKIKEINKED